MALVSTPAVILQTFRYSETSKVVRLATRELGVQSAIAKGVMRPRSPFGAALETLSEGVAQLYHKETRDLQTMAAFDVTDLRRDLARDLGRFAGAAALAEVMLKMAPAAPLPAAYDTFTRALDLLATADPHHADAVAARWIWLLVGVLGFAPELDACVRDGTAVAGNGGVAFSTAEGGVLCPKCAGPQPPTRLPPDAYRDLLALNDAGAALPQLDAAHAAAHRRLVARFVRHHMDESGPLSAMDFWERRAWVTPRRLVVGTAGHIDHGKTALVKALTGVDTDRWEEEKRRGITIDLGFAPLPLGDGLAASVVDVPGHEGFVKNMLAGATGIDVALLVIAADEGVMPQTEEHLAIVELLGVRRGVPVLSKRDLVDDEWLALVRTEVAERLKASRVRWDPPIAVSALTGAGLDDLRAALVKLAGDLPARPTEDLFRLPIDRVFAVAGAGTVVTGSTWSGSVAVGDSVRVLPLDREVRVRSIEVHGEAAEHAVPGRRTALALVGVDKDELDRGHVAVTGPAWASTTTLDVALELLPGARKPLAVRTRIRVHLGTAEVLARVAQVRSIAPGETGLARLLLERPLVARGGDRFVVRSFSPVTTIGGGVVLDPFPPKRPRVAERGLAVQQSPGERLARLVDEAGLHGVPVRDLPVRMGILPGEVSGAVAQAGKGVLASGELLVSRKALAAEVERLAQVVGEHHQTHPLDPGLSLQALRAAVAVPDVAGPVWDLLVDHGVKKQAFEVSGAVVRRPGWKATLESHAGDSGARLVRRLIEARWQVPTVAELQQEFTDLAVPPLLAHLAREGGVEQVDQERYASKPALEEFRGALEVTLRELGRATPAQLRDRTGLTRKYLIPLLEWADRRGITKRDGDARVLARLTGAAGGS